MYSEYPNELTIPSTDENEVDISAGHWLNSGQIDKIIFHDGTYIELDVASPYVCHVRRKGRKNE